MIKHLLWINEHANLFVIEKVTHQAKLFIDTDTFPSPSPRVYVLRVIMLYTPCFIHTGKLFLYIYNYLYIIIIII